MQWKESLAQKIHRFWIQYWCGIPGLCQSVPHQRLLSKLKSHGINQWQSFQMDRKLVIWESAECSGQRYQLHMGSSHQWGSTRLRSRTSLVLDLHQWPWWWHPKLDTEICRWHQDFVFCRLWRQFSKCPTGHRYASGLVRDMADEMCRPSWEQKAAITDFW